MRSLLGFVLGFLTVSLFIHGLVVWGIVALVATILFLAEGFVG